MNARIGGLSGLAFLALSCTTLALAPGQPAPDALASDIAAWYSDHATGIQLSALLFGIGALGLIVWFGSLVHTLDVPDSGRGLVLVAGLGVAMTAVGWTMSAVIGSGTAVYIDELNPETVVLSTVVSFAAASLGVFGFAALFGAMAVLTRESYLPSWLNTVAVLGAIVHLAATATVATDSAAVFSLVYLASALTVLWVAGTSIVMLRRDITVPLAVDRPSVSPV